MSEHEQEREQEPGPERAPFDAPEGMEAHAIGPGMWDVKVGWIVAATVRRQGETYVVSSVDGRRRECSAGELDDVVGRLAAPPDEAEDE